MRRIALIFPRNDRVNLPTFIANRIERSSMFIMQMHAGNDNLQLQFWIFTNGVEHRAHQAEFGAGAGDETDFSSFWRRDEETQRRRDVVKNGFTSSLRLYVSTSLLSLLFTLHL